MKKGFTLIELLAVIVILAIIALIATPIVLDIIEDSKESSKVRSAENYIHALELEIANKGLKNETLSDGVYSVDEIEVEIDGEEPTTGFVQIINGEIDKYSLIIDNQQIDSNEEYDVWDGSIAEISSIEELEKDEEGNYLINTSKELAWIAQQTNGGNTFEGITFSLQSNLDLNNLEWTPIGDSSENIFSGNFYGNNFVIKKIYINRSDITYNGLFGHLKSETTYQLINNLIIKNSNIAGLKVSGSLSGVSRNNVTIENITSFNNKITATNYSVGGIVGQISGTIKNSKTIYNIIESGTRQVGGIAGYGAGSEGSNNGIIENCYTDSKTTIYSKGTYDESVGYATSLIGGIVGNAKYYNLSNVKSNATVIGEGSHAGGIVGQIGYSSKIENAATGEYSYVKGLKLVGGIAGLLGSDSSLYNAFSKGKIVYFENYYVGKIYGDIYSAQYENIDSSATIEQVK